MGDHDPRRTTLPIPDLPYSGLTTYDAKDPATSFPPIRRSGHRTAPRMS